MNPGVQLKYGQIRGGHVGDDGFWAASQTVKRASGRFVYLDAAGRLVLNADGVGTIWGFAESGLEAEATTADDRVNVNISLDAVYRIPIDSGTYVKAMRGDTCDIAISSNVQGAQLDASAENTLIIVGGDADNNEWVDVKINPSEQGTGNGAED